MRSQSVFNRKPKTTLAVITLILATLLVLLLEVVLRFTPYNIFVSKGQGGFPPMFIKDDKAGFDLADNFKHGIHSTIDLSYPVHTNNIGCFDKKAEPGENYNVIIGDSFTWGFEPLEKKWTTILEKNTNQRFYKCGVMAYGPKQALNKLKKIIKKSGKTPQTIIFAYYWNDLNDDYANPALTVYKGNVVNRIKSFNYENGHIDYLGDKKIASNYEHYQQYGSPDYLSFSFAKKIKFWIKSHSIVANLLHNALSRESDESEPFDTVAKGNEALYHRYLSKMSIQQYPWLQKAWKKHLGNIKAMADYAKSINSTFMIVILPTKAEINTDYTSKETLSNLKASRLRLTSFLEENKIPYLDLYTAFSQATSEGKNLYLPHDMHFSLEGEAITGKALSDFLKKHLSLIQIK